MVVIVVLMTLTPRGFFALFGHSVEVCRGIVIAEQGR
jgi:hypothetical protein